MVFEARILLFFILGEFKIVSPQWKIEDQFALFESLKSDLLLKQEFRANSDISLLVYCFIND